jgi:hypothetical protein
MLYSWAQVSTQLFIITKTMGCKVARLPLLLERVGVRRIKSSVYIPLIPAFSLWRRSAITCVDTYDSWVETQDFTSPPLTKIWREICPFPSFVNYSIDFKVPPKDNG